MSTNRETRSTCPYCGVGCGVIIESDGPRVTGVRGDPDHPANLGRLCTKGSTLHLTAAPAIARQTRLLQPLQRTARDRAPEPIGWDAAMAMAASRLGRIIDTHGPDAVGFYVSGQLLTEDYYIFNKLVKGLIGTNNIDTNSRLCMSSAVAGYKLTLGADAPPASYEDVDHADCLFIAGSNTAWAHPVLFRRIEAARERRPDLRIVVVDPRRTDTAALADLHLAIHPGTDVLLFHGLLHVMLREGWTQSDWIADHTHGFDDLAALVRATPVDAVARTCGIAVDDLVTAARWFARSQATLSLYCQGLNQSANGTAKNTALINLHLATAQIGRAGAGPFSLTGQPNAMGGREVGGLANLLSAHRDMANPMHRAEVAALWGVPTVPSSPGRTAVEMFQAAADGEIRALWIACTNPLQSLPDQSTVQRALDRAEFVVVQEAFATTATAACADLLLPATTWGEKEGTVTNSERRISRVRAAVPPPCVDPATAPRPDWAIALDLAHRLEAQLRPGLRTLFPYDGPEPIWNEHRASTQGRDLDITGLSYERLETHGPQQWPCTAAQAAKVLAAGGQTLGTPRLYTDGRFATPDGRARFALLPWEPVADPCDIRYPIALTTGRLRDQWHGMSRTGTLGRLFGHVPEPALNLHPQDMAHRGLVDGDLVHVTSRRASIVIPVQGGSDLREGQAFLAMHWGPEYLGGTSSTGHATGGVNALTTPHTCPRSHQPEFKHTAIKVLKSELPWRLLAMAWLPEDEVHRARQALREAVADLPFLACVPFGRERSGVLLRAAAHEALPVERIARIEQLLGLAGSDILRYEDRRRGQRRAMRLATGDGGATLQAFVLAGDIRAEAWIADLLRQDLPAQAYGRLLLSPGTQAPVALPSRGRQVCACLDVGETSIRDFLAGQTGTDGERLTALQNRHRCGTQCGSCVPELRRLIQATPALRQVA